MIAYILLKAILTSDDKRIQVPAMMMWLGVFLYAALWLEIVRECVAWVYYGMPGLFDFPTNAIRLSMAWLAVSPVISAICFWGRSKRWFCP